MKTALFDYPLPERLIAQKPADRRDESQLLVVNRSSHTIAHCQFRDLPGYLRAGDCLLRNNASVIPARLHATRPTGGQVECLLLRPAWSAGDLARDASQCAAGLPRLQGIHDDGPANEWWCLLRPGKKLPVGATFGLGDIFTATVRGKTADGLAHVAFATQDGDILAVANRIGEMPLPPYIAARDCDEDRTLDRQRYQTVYANPAQQVAVAAPTAGLHFTTELLAQLSEAGVSFAELTLHVGIGTFRPITAEQVKDHAIHREVYEIPAATQQALFNPTGRRIAVGTTSVRTIEDFLSRHPDAARWSGLPPRRSERVEGNALHPAPPHIAEAGIFIYPPRDFRGVDALITNFHQPRSTLLCLVAAFLTPGSTDGIAWLKEIYAEAVLREYRFFSYGDAMLIM